MRHTKKRPWLLGQLVNWNKYPRYYFWGPHTYSRLFPPERATCEAIMANNCSRSSQWKNNPQLQFEILLLWAQKWGRCNFGKLLNSTCQEECTRKCSATQCVCVCACIVFRSTEQIFGVTRISARGLTMGSPHGYDNILIHCVLWSSLVACITAPISIFPLQVYLRFNWSHRRKRFKKIKKKDFFPMTNFVSFLLLTWPQWWWWRLTISSLKYLSEK